MKLSVPADQDPMIHVWGTMVPGIGPAAATLSLAVYEHSTIDLLAFEAARLRMAQINGCAICKTWRTERDGTTVPDGFAEEVARWEQSDQLDPRSKAAAEFAELFATNHHVLADNSDAATLRIQDQFTERELLELAMCCGAWMSFGRLNRIFGLDEVCQLPAHAASPRPQDS